MVHNPGHRSEPRGSFDVLTSGVSQGLQANENYSPWAGTQALPLELCRWIVTWSHCTQMEVDGLCSGGTPAPGTEHMLPGILHAPCLGLPPSTPHKKRREEREHHTDAEGGCERLDALSLNTECIE